MSCSHEECIYQRWSHGFCCCVECRGVGVSKGLQVFGDFCVRLGDRVEGMRIGIVGRRMYFLGGGCG